MVVHVIKYRHENMTEWVSLQSNLIAKAMNIDRFTKTKSVANIIGFLSLSNMPFILSILQYYTYYILNNQSSLVLRAISMQKLPLNIRFCPIKIMNGTVMHRKIVIWKIWPDYLEFFRIQPGLFSIKTIIMRI